VRISINDSYFKENREVWTAFEEAYKARKLRALVFPILNRRVIDNILESCSVKPMANQILAHIAKS